MILDYKLALMNGYCKYLTYEYLHCSSLVTLSLATKLDPS